MKKIFTLACSLLIAGYAGAQTSLPDPNEYVPSNAGYYYENMGQVLDVNNQQHTEIRYYTEHSYPQMYLADHFIAFTSRINDSPAVADTLGRIDMSFLCPNKEGCGEIFTEEPTEDFLNYYLPHCGPNGITGVGGYKRIIYQEAFPNIDVHFYSNSVGPVLYFVVKPGGNPADILLQFNGQDSIALVANNLSLYLESWELRFPQAMAYQFAPGGGTATSPLPWSPIWVHTSGGQVSLNTSSYNPAENLVICVGTNPITPLAGDNLEWSTYYGAEGADMYPRMYVADDNAQFHAMGEQGYKMPPNSGYIIGSGGSSEYNWYITKFTPAGKRVWSTYFGGNGVQMPSCIKEAGNAAINDSLSGIWIAGYSANGVNYGADTVKLGSYNPAFKQRQNMGTGAIYNREGLLAVLNRGDDKNTGGHLKYATYFGSGTQSDDFIWGMDYDAPNNMLYIAGNTNNTANFVQSTQAQNTGNFALYPGSSSTAFYQGNKQNASDNEGFIAAFSLNNMNLVWSTLFGGASPDEIRSLKVVYDQNNQKGIYIGGFSLSSDPGSGSYPAPITSHPTAIFPFANPGGGAFFQNSTHDPQKPFNSFLAKFNAQHQLEWSTFLGKSATGIVNIATNSDKEIFVASNSVLYQDAAPSSAAANTQGLVPTYDNGSAYFEAPVNNNQHLYLARFGQDKKLKWATYLYGGDSTNVYYPSNIYPRVPMAIDNQGRIYISSYLAKVNAPVLSMPNMYWQPQNASVGTNDPDPFDTYLMAFNPNGQRAWATFFGGTYSPSNYPIQSASDVVTDLAVSSDSKLYINGYTACPNSPYVTCNGAYNYCDQQLTPMEDCFIARFNVAGIPTGIREARLPQGSVAVYPNPVQETLAVNLFTQINTSGRCTLRLVNPIGQTVLVQERTVYPGLNQLQLKLGNITSGIYYLHIDTEAGASAVKIIKL